MSEKWFTHASPTLFNAGTGRPQLSSCFLLTMRDDSIEGIYETLKQCAMISKSAGGIGLNVHCIRATGSYIAGVGTTTLPLSELLEMIVRIRIRTRKRIWMRKWKRCLRCFQTNGTSNGLLPMLRVYNNTARYVDQGGNKVRNWFIDFRRMECRTVSSRCFGAMTPPPDTSCRAAERWGLFLEKFWHFSNTDPRPPSLSLSLLNKKHNGSTVQSSKSRIRPSSTVLPLSLLLQNFSRKILELII